MQCPVCSVDLVMADRQGVEIDYCPKCRGIWLDRGELDKILERTATMYPAQPAGRPADDRPDRRDAYDRDRHDRYDHDDDDDHYKRRHHKRGGFLGELFDF